MKTFFITFFMSIGLAIVLFPAIGVRINETEQREWCERFETRNSFTQEEAGRYLDYCPHFDMNTQTEVNGRLVK
jgi:hypothetical protein